MKNSYSLTNDAKNICNAYHHDLSKYREGRYVRGTCWICGEERWGYRPSIEVGWSPYRNGVDLPRHPPPGVCETCKTRTCNFWRVSKKHKMPKNGETSSSNTTMTATSISNNQDEKKDGSIQLIIEGETFNLSLEEIILLDCDFLNKLIDPKNPFRSRSSASNSRSQQRNETPTTFKKEEVYIINGRNPKYFDAFLKILCCGAGGNRSGAPIEFLCIFVTSGGIKWKKQRKRREEVLQEADFWGIRERIDHFVEVISVTPASSLIRRAQFHEKTMICFDKLLPFHRRRRHDHHHRSYHQQRDNNDDNPRAGSSGSNSSKKSSSEVVPNVHCCICGVQSFWGHHYYDHSLKRLRDY